MITTWVLYPTKGWSMTCSRRRKNCENRTQHAPCNQPDFTSLARVGPETVIKSVARSIPFVHTMPREWSRKRTWSSPDRNRNSGFRKKEAQLPYYHGQVRTHSIMQRDKPGYRSYTSTLRSNFSRVAPRSPLAAFSKTSVLKSRNTIAKGWGDLQIPASVPLVGHANAMNETVLLARCFKHLMRKMPQKPICAGWGCCRSTGKEISSFPDLRLVPPGELKHVSSRARAAQWSSVAMCIIERQCCMYESNTPDFRTCIEIVSHVHI